MIFGVMLRVAARAVARAAVAREVAGVGRKTLPVAREAADAGRKGASASFPPAGRVAVATVMVVTQTKKTTSLATLERGQRILI